jgi:hypothetical protein
MSESAWRAGSMMRDERAVANFAASHFWASIVAAPHETCEDDTPAKQL